MVDIRSSESCNHKKNNALGKNAVPLGETEVSHMLYYASLTLYSTATVLSMSQLDGYAHFNRVFDAIKVVSLLFVVLKVCTADIRYSKREIAFYGLLLACSTASMVTSGSHWLVAISVYLIGAKELSFDAIVRTVFHVVTATALVVVALYLMGLLDSTTLFTKDYISGSIVERRSLGFGYVNSVGRLALCVFMCYLYLHFERFGLPQLIMAIGLSIFLWAYVVTRTASIIVFFGAVVAFSLHRIDRQRLIRFCAIVAVGAIVAGTLLPMIFQSDNALLSAVDSMTSRRLSWAHWCLENYEVTLFGQPIHTISSEKAALTGEMAFYLDNVYIRLILNYGVLAALLFFVAFLAVIGKSIRAGRADVLLLLMLMFISGIASFWPILFPLGFPLLALSTAVGSRHEDGFDNPEY